MKNIISIMFPRFINRYVSKTVSSKYGFTLIEVVVAIAILFILIVPGSILLEYLITNMNNSQKIIAIELAQQEMERTLLYSLFESETEYLVKNGTRWQISRTIRIDGRLASIEISVFKEKNSDKKDPLVSLQTLRPLSE